MISIKKIVANLPIQKKLIYSNMLAIAFAFLPVIVVMLTYEYFALRHAVLAEVRLQADIVGESSAAAMAFRDPQAAYDTLRGLKNASDLVEAHLVLKDNSLLSSFYAKNKGSSEFLKEVVVSQTLHENITFNTITLQKPIFLHEEFVGVLILKSSFSSFYTRLKWYATTVFITILIGFLLAKWIAERISKTITDPLLKLIETTQNVTAKQDYSTPIIIDSEDEVGNLSRAFREMMTQIHSRDLSMQQLAYYDRVTGIANRHYFEEKIEQSIKNSKRYGTVCYLMMIDLDDFKTVNDTLGHHIGDLLLRHVSEFLHKTMRKNDNIFRIGGDEFAIIIESPSRREPVTLIAKKIITAVSTPVVLEGHEVRVGASIGISCFPRLAHDVQSLMTTADSAMYIAKKAGKNTFVVYSAEKDEG